MVNTPNESTLSPRSGETRPHPVIIADEPQMIRTQIEQTRAQMGHTLDEIQVRLSPDYIKQQMQETIREATVEKVEKMAQTAKYKINNWRTNAVQTIKENPIPAAMIGIGLGWMLLSDNNGHDDAYSGPYYNETRQGRPPSAYYSHRAAQYGTESGPLSEAQARAAETAENAQEWVDDKRDKIQQTMQDVTATVQHQAATTTETVRENIDEAAENAQHYMAETAEQVRDQAEEARLQAQRQIRHVKRSFWQTMEENPLAVGIAAVAAGALVGLALPATERENELMGETRDRLVEEASAAAKETVHKVQTVAEQAAHTAVEEAKHEAEKQNLPTPSSTTKETSEKETVSPTAVSA